MSPEIALTYISIIGTVGTIANIWISLSLKNSILSMKLWTRENFISKQDDDIFIAPIRQGIQTLLSRQSANGAHRAERH